MHVDCRWAIYSLVFILANTKISHGQYTQYPGSTNDQYQQAGQFQQPYQYGQNQYTTQAPYTNLYPDQYGSQGIYGNQMTGPYIQESTAVTTPYTVTSPYMQVTPDCDITAQQKLASCAQQLISLGIFGASGNQLGQMTLASLKQQPSDFLIQVCNAYNRFNECVGGSRIKQACYALGPLKMRYAIADAGLDFFCGQGYNAMLSNWNCLGQVASRSDVSECQSRYSQNTVVSQLPTAVLAQGSNAICSTLQEYLRCIKDPIENSCGDNAWNTIVMAAERQASVIVPFCTLASCTIVPSLLLIALSLLISFAQ